VKAYYEIQQYSPEWYAVRRGVPTVSEFKKLLTAGGKLSEQAHGYACKLAGDVYDRQYPRAESYVSAAMKNGTMMEPEARAWYELDSGLAVRQVGFVTTDDGRFGASPDAMVGDDGCLELKSPNPQTHVEWLTAGNVLPAEHRPQVHGALIVTGRAWCDFFSYVDGLPPLRVRVKPDDYTARLREAMEVFWLKYQGVLAMVRQLSPAIELTPKPTPEQIAEESAMLAF
jgi:hypothetical protein